MIGYNSNCGKLVLLLLVYYFTVDIQVVSEARISYLSTVLLINQNRNDDKKNYSVALDVDDNIHMKHAIRLASKALGKTSPNPVVGCIILDKNGKLVGEGWHEKAGKAHAEVVALRQAGKEAIGGTAYVSLEPCNHYGRTPPCTEALITYGISRVVAGIVDPDPRVSGGGLQFLKDRGVTVRMNVEEEACKAINAPFIYRVLHKRPYMILWTSLFNSPKSKEGKSSFATSQLRLPSPAVINKLFIKLAQEVDTLLVTETQLNLLDRLSALPPHIHIIVLSSLPSHASDEERKNVLLTVHKLASSHRSTFDEIVEYDNRQPQPHQLGHIDHNNEDSTGTGRSSRKWSVLFTQSSESYPVHPTLPPAPPRPPAASGSTPIQDGDGRNRNGHNSGSMLRKDTGNLNTLNATTQPPPPPPTTTTTTTTNCSKCHYQNSIPDACQDNKVEYNSNNNSNNNNNNNNNNSNSNTTSGMEDRLLSHLLQLGCNAVLVFGGGTDPADTDPSEPSFRQQLTRWLLSGTVQRLIVSEQIPSLPSPASTERKSIGHVVVNGGADERRKQILGSVNWHDFLTSFVSSFADTENARVSSIECINALLTSNRIEEEVIDDGGEGNSTVVAHSTLLWKP